MSLPSLIPETDAIVFLPKNHALEKPGPGFIGQFFSQAVAGRGANQVVMRHEDMQANFRACTFKHVPNQLRHRHLWRCHAGEVPLTLHEMSIDTSNPQALPVPAGPLLIDDEDARIPQIPIIDP